MESINSAGSIDEMCDSIMAMILKVASESIPCRRCPRDRVIVPWWNIECEKVVKKTKEAFRRLRKNPTQENAIEFKRCRAMARKIIKAEKKKSWRVFCSTLCPNTPVKQIWSRIHKMSGKIVNSSISVLKDGGVAAVSSKEKADVFVKAFQDVHNSHSLCEESLRMREEILHSEGWKLAGKSDSDQPINKYFSLKELQDAVQAGTHQAKTDLLMNFCNILMRTFCWRFLCFLIIFGKLDHCQRHGNMLLSFRL